MKVKLSINKGAKDISKGMFSSNETIMVYNIRGIFEFSEAENKITSDHPLVKKRLFLKYNEEDKMHPEYESLKKNPLGFRDEFKSVENILSQKTLDLTAYSINKAFEYRDLILDAAKNFTQNAKAIAKLEGDLEVDYDKEA